jgi:hypothetical protein
MKLYLYARSVVSFFFFFLHVMYLVMKLKGEIVRDFDESNLPEK